MQMNRLILFIYFVSTILTSCSFWKISQYSKVEYKTIQDKINNNEITFSGGDGSSVENAIIISGVKNVEEIMISEQLFIMNKNGVMGSDWKAVFDGEITENGEKYDLIEINKLNENKIEQYYFDLSQLNLKEINSKLSCVTEEYKNCFNIGIDTGNNTFIINNKCIGISISHHMSVYWTFDEWSKNGEYVARFAYLHKKAFSTKMKQSDIILRALPKRDYSIDSLMHFINQTPNLKNISPRERHLDAMLFSKKITTTCNEYVIITSVFDGDGFYILLSLISKKNLQNKSLPIFRSMEESIQIIERTLKS